MREAVDNLLRDKTRPPGKATLDAKIVKRIVDLTPADPLGELASAYALWGRPLSKPSPSPAIIVGHSNMCSGGDHFSFDRAQARPGCAFDRRHGKSVAADLL
jgi:hypothetical protein